jgi:hypothetical protein
VCLEAGKTASRRKTTTKTQQRNRAKAQKNLNKRKTNPEMGVFPQPVKPSTQLAGVAQLAEGDRDHGSRVAPFLSRDQKIPTG